MTLTCLSCRNRYSDTSAACPFCGSARVMQLLDTPEVITPLDKLPQPGDLSRAIADTLDKLPPNTLTVSTSNTGGEPAGEVAVRVGTERVSGAGIVRRSFTQRSLDWLAQFRWKF